MLGVATTASTAHIKAAFRKRAKASHPDVLQDPAAGASFAELLTAYQVLIDDRQRQLYDLSLDERAGRGVRAAAAAAAADRAAEAARAAAEEHRQWQRHARQSNASVDPGDAWYEVPPKQGTWAYWLVHNPGGAPRGPVGRVREELRMELRAAMRHAYLGPKVSLAPGELPPAFEGEERSTAGLGDVMQLVSGRQLLGRHSVMWATTPLVRHITFLARDGSTWVPLCRCRRAWLPPSNMWLFPPRSALHDSGGWYIEWGGYAGATNPLWLPPEVFVLIDKSGYAMQRHLM
ncbi:hypothetical protein WJX81_005347 [Elliptochloris bilobata]|uniref:J domain-containing protein n=1 Tax=Elliptochloris bilobata TaxID=381761 RepID=A0AAW1RE02_9CHLO